MLRNDGKYEIFVIEAKSKEGDWFKYNMDFCAYPEGQPYNDFSSSGQCWQETGVHGTYDVEIALKMFLLLQKIKPEYRFRINKYTIQQESEPLWYSNTPEERKEWSKSSL